MIHPFHDALQLQAHLGQPVEVLPAPDERVADDQETGCGQLAAWIAVGINDHDVAPVTAQQRQGGFG